MYNLFERKRRFTAVMAFDDVTAFGAVRALSQAGLRVPDDCSVLGFDDIAAAAFCNPPLTTIRQPMELMGSLAGDIVLDHLSAGGPEDRARRSAPPHRSDPGTPRFDRSPTG